jgi:hypothetical protein
MNRKRLWEIFCSFFYYDKKTTYYVKMDRIYGRLVYCPAWHRASTDGFNYRDITTRRINYFLCWIVGDLDNIEDWGTLATPLIGNDIRPSTPHG